MTLYPKTIQNYTDRLRRQDNIEVRVYYSVQQRQITSQPYRRLVERWSDLASIKPETNFMRLYYDVVTTSCVTSNGDINGSRRQALCLKEPTSNDALTTSKQHQETAGVLSKFQRSIYSSRKPATFLLKKVTDLKISFIEVLSSELSSKVISNDWLHA